MKLSCDSLDLSDALTQVGKALPLKKVMPILNGIKLKAEGDTLTLTATDLELSIEKKIKADIFTEGETVILGKYFTEYVRKIDKEDVIIDTSEENTLKLTYGENNGYIQTMEADEYPAFKNVNDENSFYIVKKELKNLIEKIIFCTASEDNRPTLKGCSIEISDNKIIGVASDGYRLAYCKKEIEYGGADIKIIVPARSMSEISKLLDDSDENVKVSIEKNYFMVDLENTKIVTRLIEGEYINYNKIIPSDFTTTVFVDKKALDTAIDRASLATRTEKKSVVKLEIREKRMSISAESEISGINEIVNIDLLGHDLNIGFNARYLSDSLRAISDDFVKLCFTTSTAPGVIVPTEKRKTNIFTLFCQCVLSTNINLFQNKKHTAIFRSVFCFILFIIFYFFN